ncbi:MAG: hypothetical protein VKQ33_02155 [Candidatus Sericytochromatia bacterium]|nr:hypothetical protein [Candidatus Sericytochromatia bacterium]
MGWRAGGGLLVAGCLAGCLAATPLPLSPLQLLLGGWPPSPPPGGERPVHTILGNTFSYPQLGLSIARPDARAWEFQATPDGLAVLTLDGPVVRVDGPSLQLTVVPLPPEVVLGEALGEDVARLLQAGVGVVQGEVVVDGLPAIALWLTQAQPGPTGAPAEPVRSWRLYLAHDGLLVLAEARAEAATFLSALPAFEAMLETLRVPQEPARAEPGVRVPLGRGGPLAVPALGLRLRTLEPTRWLASSLGTTLTVEHREPPAGARTRPTLTVTVGDLPAGVDLRSTLAQERAALEQAGASVTVASATLGGLAGEGWRWGSGTGAASQVQRRITASQGTRVAIAQYAVDAPLAGDLEPELAAVLDALEVVGAGAATPAAGR